MLFHCVSSLQVGHAMGEREIKTINKDEDEFQLSESESKKQQSIKRVFTSDLFSDAIVRQMARLCQIR